MKKFSFFIFLQLFSLNQAYSQDFYFINFAELPVIPLNIVGNNVHARNKAQQAILHQTGVTKKINSAKKLIDKQVKNYSVEAINYAKQITSINTDYALVIMGVGHSLVVKKSISFTVNSPFLTNAIHEFSWQPNHYKLGFRMPF